jgi:hypothetical protein
MSEDAYANLEEQVAFMIFERLPFEGVDEEAAMETARDVVAYIMGKIGK